MDDQNNPLRLVAIVIVAWSGLFLLTALLDPFPAYVARVAGYVVGAGILLAFYWRYFRSPWPWLVGAVIVGAAMLYMDYPGG